MSSPIPILYQDEHLLVADKPSGLLSVSTPGASGRTLVQALAEQGLAALPVHRLDRDVSGAILLARNEPTRARLEQLFRERDLEKSYWALAQGHVKPEVGEIKFKVLDEGSYARVSAVGKPALTRYRTIARHRATTEVEIELVTGRHNQIRLHFAHAGFPLVGERKYARGRDATVRAPRVALHAWRIAFDHPQTGENVRVEAPLPRDLVSLRERA